MQHFIRTFPFDQFILLNSALRNSKDSRRKNQHHQHGHKSLRRFKVPKSISRDDKGEVAHDQSRRNIALAVDSGFGSTNADTSPCRVPSYGRNREDRDKNRKTDRERKTEEWNRGKEKRGEFNMKQHHNVSNIRRSSSSSSLIPKIVKIRSYKRHPQPHTLVYERRRLGGSLMLKFSIRQTSVHGNGSSFSHHEEPNMPGS